MAEQVSVPIWLIVMVSAGWVALVFAAWLFGRADLKGALDIARDSDTTARFASIKENAARGIRTAVVAHVLERAALSGQSLQVAATHGVIRPVWVYPQPAAVEACAPTRKAWALIDRQGARAVSLADDPQPETVPDGDRPVEVDEDDYPRGHLGAAALASAFRNWTRRFTGSRAGNQKVGRHRLAELSGDTQQLDRERIQRVLTEGRT